MSSHAKALGSFAGKLVSLLMVRAAVRWAAGWLLFWGVVVLAARIAGAPRGTWLLAGTAVGVLVVAAAAAREYRRRASFSMVRATYDSLNHCGGLIMAEASADMASWRSSLPRPASPRLRWRCGGTFGLLGLSILFVSVTLCLPDRLARFRTARPLQVGKVVGELRTEIQTLQQEKILEPKSAEDLQRQLSRLKEQSSALDPDKTWEALDHMRESNSDLARQAAEEALSKMSRLTEAETLAGALGKAAESGLGQDTATQAARDVAAMLKAARLEDGLLKISLPPDLLSAANSLSKADLEKLMAALASSKANLGATMTNLANLRLIDPRLLAKCRNAGQCPNPDALAAFLCQSTNQCDSFCQAAAAYCRNIRPGGGGAPMTWKDQSSEADTAFQEDALPPAARLSDAQLVGVSRAAPELSKAGLADEPGALSGARGGGGAAYSQVILPRHRQVVRQFFNREP